MHDDLPTAMITLPPAFVKELKQLASARKSRGSKLPFVLGLAALGIIASLGADPMTREFVATRWQRPVEQMALASTGALATATQTRAEAHAPVAPASKPEPATAQPSAAQASAASAPLVVRIETPAGASVAPHASATKAARSTAKKTGPRGARR